MQEDPQAQNYDPKHKIIRSLFNGSRGPLLRKATAVDWAGDPIEVEHRFSLGHGERSYTRAVIDARGFRFCDGCRRFLRTAHQPARPRPSR